MMTLNKLVIVKVKYFLEPYPSIYRALRFFYRMLWKKELWPSAKNESLQEPHSRQSTEDKRLPELHSIIPLCTDTTQPITIEDIPSNKIGYIPLGEGEQVLRSSILTIEGIDEEEWLLKINKIFTDVNYISSPLRAACFDDAIVDLNQGIVLAKQQLIKESLAYAELIHQNPQNWKTPVATLLRDKATLPLFERPLLHCFHYGSAAYGHFILDILLLVNRFQKALQAGELTILIPNYVPEWAISIMKELSLPETAFYRPQNQGVLCNRLFVSSALNTSSTYSPDVYSCHALRQAFLGSHIKNKNRYIFLSRLNQINHSIREFKNEQAVHEALIARGFEILEPSNMPFQEQVRAFAEAYVIVGDHGSTFGNLVFAQAGTHIVDLMPLHWVGFWNSSGRSERWLLNFTTAMQLNYHLLLCHSKLIQPFAKDSAPAAKGIEFSVDIDKLEEILDRI